MAKKATKRQDNVTFKKKKGYTQVQNYAPDDITLSDKALGLYTRIQRWITFEAEDFECSKAFIKTKTPSGEKAFDSAWNELKERGYLKMYCIPPANWTAELLDEPQPDTPHTYYLNTDGEIKSTNVDRAAKKAAKANQENGSEYYPQNGSNTGSEEYYPQKRGNTKSSNIKSRNKKSDDTENGNKNGGKNINTALKSSFNTSLQNNQSINQSIEQKEQNPQPNKKIDRVIDMDLINEIKEQIDYETLKTGSIFVTAIDETDLEAAREDIAILKTVKESQTISGSEYSAEFIRHRADTLNRDHVEYVFECFEEQRDKVYNIRKYLLTAFFNAPATMGAYYANNSRSKDLI